MNVIFYYMTDISDRIKTIIDHYGNGKNTEFAALVGTSEGNIRGYLKGVMPKGDFLSAVVRNCEGLSAIWLLTGEGGMLAADHAEKKSCGDPIIDRLLAMIEDKDNTIREQAEEIGQLRERLTHQGGNAEPATCEPPAHAV